MAKIYTHIEKLEKNIANNDGFNEESQQIFSEFNGQLAAEQLPFEGFDEAKFVVPTRVADVPTLPNESSTLGIGWVGIKDSYYITSKKVENFTWLRDPSLTTTILGPPVETFTSDAPNWTASIYPLSLAYNEGVFLRIPTKEGMLKGCATVDTEYYGFSKRTATGEEPITGNFGTEGRVTLYVFVNDVLVGTTGPQPAGKRQTYQIPFAIPVGASEAVDIDIRASATFDIGSNNVTFPDAAKVNFYSAQLWVRNQYR